MQSYLEYRRLGQNVHKQIRDEESRTARIGRRAETSTPPLETPNTSEGDDEKEKSKELPDADAPLEEVETPQQEDPNEIGYQLDGIDARDRTTREGKGEKVFVVGWNGDDDPDNPHNWSQSKKARVVLTVGLLAFAVTLASSIDSGVIPQAAKEFGVSEVVESLATGNFLIGFGVGTLYAGPLSEIYGRNPVYVGSLSFFCIWEMASGLAPNIGAQLTFRFLAGFCGSPALTMSGGTCADVYNSVEKTYGFPLFAIPGFGGPILGPIIAAWIGPSPHISWRWTEWVSLIAGGITLAVVVLTMPETFAPQLLKWKAHHLREATGDGRFRAPAEITEETFWNMIERNLARPFILIRTELIIILMTLYFAVIYIIMFTFFVGYV